MLWTVPLALMVNGANDGTIDKKTGVPSASEHKYVCMTLPASYSSLTTTIADCGVMIGRLSLTFSTIIET